jgi:thiamine pyrophosphate-dependent acetolactate synthase large subunit-like protein
MISSREAMEYLAGRLSDELVVASLGYVKYELAAANDRPENFYLWNSMGMACSIGLGMASARPERRVIVLDGDGSLLMNLNSLASEGWRAPRNFAHIVFDNRAHYLTGKQPTATSARADLARMAEGAGFPHAERVETLAAFRSAVDRALVEEGPWFVQALVEQQPRQGRRPPKSPTLLKHRFMDKLGVQH